MLKVEIMLEPNHWMEWNYWNSQQTEKNDWNSHFGLVVWVVFVDPVVPFLLLLLF